MLPLKRIICPTDFSEPSFEGLKIAVELSENYSAELIVLYVVTPVPIVSAVGAPTALYYPIVSEEKEDNAAKLLVDVKANRIPDHINCRTIIVTGQPAVKIAEAAQKIRADIIVMATHGQSGWQRFISGSVTERVVRLAACPVLAVPAPNQD